MPKTPPSNHASENRLMVDHVLLATRDDDPLADRLERLLLERGAEVIRFDPGGFPSQAGVSIALESDGTARRLLTTPEQAVDLNTVTALWVGRPHDPAPDASITDPVVRRYVAAQCADLVTDLWAGLGCPAIPAAPDVMRRAALKTAQLLEAARLGFELPPTLVTTDPDALLDFYCTHDGRVITKVIEQLGAYVEPNDFARYTEPVATRDLAHVDDVSRCPVIVQAYVDKALELRVTVVGGRVFAAAIHSQRSNHARLDWRRYDLRTTPHRPYVLPEETAARCVQLVEALELRYAALDLILTPDGRHVFLELNPDGQYLWIEEATGLPISDALCDLLLGRDVPRPLAAAVQR